MVVWAAMQVEPGLSAAVQAPASAPDGPGLEAVVLVDRPPLRAGQLVQVRARSLGPGVLVGDLLFPRYLVGEAWIDGDALALRAEPGDPARGAWLAPEGHDLDGDGRADRLWHAVRSSHEAPSGREHRDGYLVLEAAGRASFVPVASSDGWGNAARFVRSELRDMAGTPRPDLLALLETDVCEVGPGGHVLLVVTFGAGRPEIAVEHQVRDPVAVGLAQYEIGSVRVRGSEIVARTVVASPEHEAGEPVQIRVERWRHGVRTTSFEPLRTREGDPVLSVRGLTFDPTDPPAFLVAAAGGARWRDDVALAEELYARALREAASPSFGWDDWIVIDPP